jgi:hypothetical protein
VTGIGAETVVVVASMRGCHRARGHFGDSAHRLLLHHCPPLLSPDVSPTPWCGPSPDLSIHCNPRTPPSLCIWRGVAERIIFAVTNGSLGQPMRAT